MDNDGNKDIVSGFRASEGTHDTGSISIFYQDPTNPGTFLSPITYRRHHGFFGDPNVRTLLKGLVVEHSAEGVGYLLSQTCFYIDREALSRVVFGLEPTSVYHKPLAEHLISQGRSWRRSFRWERFSAFKPC
jgi:hypothetical protein